MVRPMGRIRWVDMLAGDVLALRPDGSVGRRHVGTIAAALRPRRDGGAVIGVERGFTLESADGSLAHLDDVWTAADVRMNDGGLRPRWAVLLWVDGVRPHTRTRRALPVGP